MLSKYFFSQADVLFYRASAHSCAHLSSTIFGFFFLNNLYDLFICYGYYYVSCHFNAKIYNATIKIKFSFFVFYLLLMNKVTFILLILSITSYMIYHITFNLDQFKASEEVKDNKHLKHGNIIYMFIYIYVLSNLKSIRQKIMSNKCRRHVDQWLVTGR
jgi:hypothetical protein